MKKPIKLILAVLIASVMAILPCGTVLAIDNPDDDPEIDDVWAWRNILETGDQFYLILENTPYATTPTDYRYSEAYVWRFFNGAVEEAQAVGFDYDEDGYGYNVIGFYFSAADAPAWAGDYTLRLSGNPGAFADPPVYNFDIPAGSYSLLTDSADVKADIAEKIITIATGLYSKWGLNATTALIAETETATVLSSQGQTFFRGAIYGLQGMAPAAFSMTVTNYDIEIREWVLTYQTDLEAQHAGNPIETAFDAGESLLGVDYNLFGLLLALGIGIGLLVANWMIAGGNLWKGVIEMVPIMVVGTRMALVGMGELALVGAVCMIFINAKIWRLL